MYKVHLEREIAISHILSKHKGKCSNLHGHNLKVEVDVSTDSLCSVGSSTGMVIDFGDVKRAIDELDHQDINSFFEMQYCKLSASLANSIVDDRDRAEEALVLYKALSSQPTAERLASYFALKICDAFREIGQKGEFKINVKVHEATNQWAEYSTSISRR